MTKADVQVLKGIINKERKYTTYFSSKTQALSVRVYTYINNDYSAETEKSAIDKFLNLIRDTPFKAEVIHRTYQGFIHDTCIILK